jgi:hypothetical protein
MQSSASPPEYLREIHASCRARHCMTIESYCFYTQINYIEGGEVGRVPNEAKRNEKPDIISRRSISTASRGGDMRKSILCIMFLLLVIFGAGQSQHLAQYRQGQAGFEAPPSIIAMPAFVHGIIIDTSDCGQCLDTLPYYRFLGDLLVDSIIYEDSTRPVTNAEQMQGISIESSELRNVLQQAHVFRLARSFRGVIPGDTMRWNPVTQKMDTLPDLSWHYDFRFDPNITVDSVVSLLSTVNGLVSYGGIPIFYRD